MHMTLDEYLNGPPKITESEFSKMSGLDQGHINRIRRRLIDPTLETLRTIERVTGGVVTPNDFLPARAPAPSPQPETVQ